MTFALKCKQPYSPPSASSKRKDQRGGPKLYGMSQRKNEGTQAGRTMLGPLYWQRGLPTSSPAAPNNRISDAASGGLEQKKVQQRAPHPPLSSQEDRGQS